MYMMIIRLKNNKVLVSLKMKDGYSRNIVDVLELINNWVKKK